MNHIYLSFCFPFLLPLKFIMIITDFGEAGPPEIGQALLSTNSTDFHLSAPFSRFTLEDNQQSENFRFEVPAGLTNPAGIGFANPGRALSGACFTLG